MADVDRWQLPDGVEEVLPARAEVVERLRPVPFTHLDLSFKKARLGLQAIVS